MRASIGTVVRAASICLLLLGVSGIASAATSTEATDPQRIRQAIDLAAEHLVKMQTEKGLFRYDMDFKKGRPTGQSSIVRQVGAGFSLAEYLSTTRSPSAEQAVRNLLDTLRKTALVFRKRSQWVVADNRTLKTARTGATALALLTEVLYYRATGDGRFEAARQGWLNGLLALRLGKRGFRRTPYSRRESPYFNGEAWLALAHYFDTFRDPKVGAVLDELDHYLVETYAKKPDVGFYHWGVMAAAVRYRTSRDFRLLTFIEDQTRHFLQKLRPEVKPGRNTCYALEGLLTASAVLGEHMEDSEILSPLSQRLEAEIAKNLTLQLLDVTTVKAPPAKRSRKPIDMKDYRGLFFQRADRTYTRIDHTQHCLSAFVKLKTIQLAGARN